MNYIHTVDEGQNAPTLMGVGAYLGVGWPVVRQGGGLHAHLSLSQTKILKAPEG